MTNKNLLTLAALVASLSVAGVASAQTPIAYYNFDNNIGSNTVADQSGNGFDATWQGTGTASYGTGIVGGAWDGSGSDDDHFRTAPLTALSGVEDLSISLWVNADSVPSGQDGLFVAREATINTGGDDQVNQNFGLSLQSNLGIDSRIDGGAVDAPANSAPLGVWTHVASVYDGFSGLHTVYINGSQVSQANTVFDINWISAGEWLIGEDSCCGDRELNGRIDDLAIFDTILTAGQISTIASNGAMGIAFDGTVDNDVAGDVDGDGDVDLIELDNDFVSDFDTIASNFLTTTTNRSDGDLTLDGTVNLLDFRAWKNEFSPPPGAGSAAATVPEPSALVLCGLAMASFGLRRRS